MSDNAQRDDYESKLDCIRQVTSEIRFALGVQLIEARHDPPEIAQALSRLAEAAICTAAQAAEQEFAQVHGRIEDNELVILGLGRLGGGALTHASDLDMIYLFSGDYSAESNGARPLGGTLYFNRLASRVTAALSVPTAQGALYEVDTRLRPQGNQGPLAVSIEAFAKYQKESAWTWEHMALARARVLVGPAEAREALAATIIDVLSQPRDAGEVRQAVLTMRGEMALHKTPRGPLDVKLQRGGLVDMEFLVHCLQLQHASRLAASEPDLLNPDLPSAIRVLVRHELVPEALLSAYLLMTDILVAGRLLAPDGRQPPAAAAKALAQACHRNSYAELLRDLAVARSCVAHAWAGIFDQTLETDNE
jgi:glutamate-ammonia-ligase adenylyltransferase